MIHNIITQTIKGYCRSLTLTLCGHPGLIYVLSLLKNGLQYLEIIGHHDYWEDEFQIENYQAKLIKNMDFKLKTFTYREVSA